LISCYVLAVPVLARRFRYRSKMTHIYRNNIIITIRRRALAKSVRRCASFNRSQPHLAIKCTLCVDSTPLICARIGSDAVLKQANDPSDKEIEFVEESGVSLLTLLALRSIAAPITYKMHAPRPTFSQESASEASSTPTASPRPSTSHSSASCVEKATAPVRPHLSSMDYDVRSLPSLDSDDSEGSF
jgi:hypothetical protein